MIVDERNVGYVSHFPFALNFYLHQSACVVASSREVLIEKIKLGDISGHEKHPDIIAVVIFDPPDLFPIGVFDRVSIENLPFCVESEITADYSRVPIF